MEDTLKTIRNEEKKLKQEMPKSYGQSTPSASAVATEKRIKSSMDALQARRDKVLKEKWYTNESDVENEPKGPTGLTRLTNALQAPLQGVVGIAQSIAGKNEGRDIFENIDYNVKEKKQLFGGFLQDIGAPSWMAKPLGFGLDLALDPINLLTSGGASVIGKTATGAVKGLEKAGISGAIKASSKGAYSAALEDWLDVIDWIPGVGKTKAFQKVAGSVSKAADDFYDITKIDPMSGMNKGIFGAKSYDFYADTSKVERSRTLGGYLQDVLKAKFPDAYKKGAYDVDAWMRLEKAKDDVIKVKPGVFGGELGAVKQSGEAVEKGLETKLIDDVSVDTGKVKTDIDRINEQLTQDVDEAAYIANSGKRSFVNRGTSDEVRERLVAESDKTKETQDKVRKMLQMNAQKTGIDWYDDLSERMGSLFRGYKKITTDPDKMKDISIGSYFRKNSDGEFVRTINKEEALGVVTNTSGNSITYQPFGKLGKVIKGSAEGVDYTLTPGGMVLEAMQGMNSLFKAMKVPGNVASHTNALFGNFIMDKMAGWDVVKNVPYVARAYKFLSGQQGVDFVLNYLVHEGSDFAEVASRYPNYFKSTFGFNPLSVGGKEFWQKMIDEGKVAGEITSANEHLVMDAIKNMPNDFRKFLSEVAEKKGMDRQSLIEDFKKGLKNKPETPSQLRSEGAEGVDSAVLSLDIDRGLVMQWMKNKAEEGNLGFKLLTGMMEKSGTVFEWHDQASKLGKAIRANTEGLTHQEMLKLSRMIPSGITKADVVGETLVNGQKRYRLSWEKSMDLVNETNLQYAAMPAFVRMMRSIPLLGSPFISFTYGFAPKTIKTIYHNPAAFNEVSFALSEFGRDSGELEKWGMDPNNPDSKWNEDFLKPYMYKLPFSQEFPAFLDLSSVIPYYSMNLYDPASTREFEQSLPSGFIKTIDTLQIAKDPMGQVLMDYFLLPMMLKEERSLNQFGQPVLPEDADFWDQLAYGSRAYLESAVSPTVGGAAGLVGGKVAPGITELVPSNTYRKLSNAVQGKNSIGITSKDEDIVARALAGLAGFKIRNMNLDYIKPPEN